MKAEAGNVKGGADMGRLHGKVGKVAGGNLNALRGGLWDNKSQGINLKQVK